ncbi:hypothetical protein CEXT_743241 [Caerostris extrusa]|uniref:Uncharacterized protein n=1 Tax=Caerostris extrusa TaxID=172846 RepID=A0AAV4VVM2_CAEEX|nr:hypothetical protein CEXT_743241 [Caerostris extrusa]
MHKNPSSLKGTASVLGIHTQTPISCHGTTREEMFLPYVIHPEGYESICCFLNIFLLCPTEKEQKECSFSLGHFTSFHAITRADENGNLISQLFRTSVAQNSKQNSPCTANYALHSLDEPNGNGQKLRTENSTSGYLQK